MGTKGNWHLISLKFARGSVQNRLFLQNKMAPEVKRTYLNKLSVKFMIFKEISNPLPRGVWAPTLSIIEFSLSLFRYGTVPRQNLVLAATKPSNGGSCRFDGCALSAWPSALGSAAGASNNDASTLSETCRTTLRALVVDRVCAKQRSQLTRA